MSQTAPSDLVQLGSTYTNVHIAKLVGFEQQNENDASIKDD